eukprot:2877820-Pyramimonas_sp.AAC.1
MQWMRSMLGSYIQQGWRWIMKKFGLPGDFKHPQVKTHMMKDATPQWRKSVWRYLHLGSQFPLSEIKNVDTVCTVGSGH